MHPIVHDLTAQVDRLQENGSGRTLHQINSVNICFNAYKRFSSAGKSYIPLPPSIQNGRACINVKNNDNRCFMWAVLSALHDDHSQKTRRANHVSNYSDFLHELNFGEGENQIEFPVNINDISKFEELNPGISINVYFFECQYVSFGKCYRNILQPLRLTENPCENHINLLLLVKYDGGLEVAIEKGEGIDENEIVYTPDIYDRNRKKYTLHMD